MKILLDTNIYYGDWHLRGAQFRYLFHFINNEGHELLLPRVVIQEAENIQSRELAALLALIKKNLRDADRLNGEDLLSVAADLAPKPYEIERTIRERTENIVIVEYGDVPHQQIVQRALAKTRPFQEGEKGYRDTLIWLSLLRHIEKSEPPDIVAFITANKTDFFDPKATPYRLHLDLQQDVSQLGSMWTIAPFASLFDFVASTIDKDTHALDHTTAEGDFGNYIEEQGLAYIRSLDTSVVISLQAILCRGSLALMNAEVDHLEITEGIEDLNIDSTSDLRNGDVYVSCTYNLRRVELTLSIPSSDYLIHRESLEGSGRFYDRDTAYSSVLLTTTVRPYFSASFIHNTQSKIQRGFAVSNFDVR